MGEVLTLPVPEMLHGTYAVAAATPPGDPMELARDQVAREIPAPLRELTLGMLGSPLLTLDLRPAAQFPPLPTDLLAAFGASPGRLAELTAATHVLAIRSAYQPGWPPAHEWAARAVAAALGAALDAPVVDVFTPRLLDQAPLRASLPDGRGHTRLADWMLLVHTETPDGCWLHTRGLARFGLPELHADTVPPTLVDPCGELLNGLARKLLDLWTDALRTGRRSAFAELPETVPVTPADVAAAHGGSDPATHETPVRLRLDTAGSQPLLTVLPPPHGGLAALCDTLFA